VYCTTKSTEVAIINASSEAEALLLAQNNPDEYDWNECGELENDYEVE
jgi:hypothetical protein